MPTFLLKLAFASNAIVFKSSDIKSMRSLLLSALRMPFNKLIRISGSKALLVISNLLSSYYFPFATRMHNIFNAERTFDLFSF